MITPGDETATIVDAFWRSVAKYGIQHTHDVDCRTWRGQNWPGACDCTLPDRLEQRGR